MRSKPLSFPRIAGRSSVRASGNPTWNSRVRARGICASRRRGRGRRATRGRNAPGIFLLLYHHHPFFCCCLSLLLFSRRVPRAQRGAMKRCENAFRCFPIAIASHIARWISPRETPTTSSSQSLFEEKDDKKEGKRRASSTTNRCSPLRLRFSSSFLSSSSLCVACVKSNASMKTTTMV